MAASTVNVRTIKPDPIKNKAMFDMIERMAKEVEAGMLDDFQATTASWEHKVEFDAVVSMRPSVYISVNTLDEIFGYVNDGTRAHPIKPKGKWPLRFRWGGKGSYKAKTQPKTLGSRPGGPKGPEVRLASVQHPGTKARQFDTEIQKKWRKEFKVLMQESLEDAAWASGHGMP